MAEQTHSRSMYLTVYVALMALLILTVGLSFVDFGAWPNNVIAMFIAVIKFVLIALFFMHLRFNPWITWFFAGAGFLWLGILIVLSMSDYLTRNHPPGDGPKGEPVFIVWPDPAKSAK